MCFVLNLEKTFSESLSMLQESFADDVGGTAAFEWCKHFINGWLYIEDDNRSRSLSGWVSPENISTAPNKKILEKGRLSIR